MAPSERHFSRAGAAAALSGLIIYAVSAVLHPGTAPHHTAAAFEEYARQQGWALIHLAEFSGIVLMSLGAIALGYRLRRGAAGVWAFWGAGTMLVFSSVYAVFAAVDGVALGILVRRWVAAPPEQQSMFFEAAFAVRQIEAGLFSLQWFTFGLASSHFAIAFFTSDSDDLASNWRIGMCLLSGLASIGTLAFAVAQATYGFSEVSMNFQTGLYAGALWVIGVVAFLSRHPAGRVSTPRASRAP